MRSSLKLLAVSGRVGANIAGDEKGGFGFEDVAGQSNLEVHHEPTEKGIEVRIRHVAVRSPILYDGRKLRKLGGIVFGAEQDGAADIDVSISASSADFSFVSEAQEIMAIPVACDQYTLARLDR
jgi:hypothetical protein